MGGVNFSAPSSISNMTREMFHHFCLWEVYTSSYMVGFSIVMLDMLVNSGGLDDGCVAFFLELPSPKLKIRKFAPEHAMLGR